MARLVGTILDGKFKIVQVLGEGGMGTVYKVEQLETTPPYYYAVKELLISPNTSEEDRKAAIERFNREISLLRTLKHPRIAALMLPFQENGNYYFVMEFVPGRSLEKILEDNNGPLPAEQTVKWMMQVCEALSYIHSRNPPIILRDLKPGNIMVTPDNEIQLIDFGIARQFDPHKRTNTENLGTISYASPEHLGSITTPGQKRTAQNPGKLVQTDARSDIYSLGATMYHLLTGFEPDPIQTPAVGSILAKNPHLHKVVEQVIIKAMQQDPAQRFQNAEAMRVALQSCLPNAVPLPSTVQIPNISPNATIIVQTNSAQSAGGGVPCPKCGFLNRLGARFCKRDGQPLIQGAVVAPPQQVPARAAHAPIQARPVQQPTRTRPGSSIQARPVSAAPTGDPMVPYRAGLQLLTNKKYAEAVNQFKLAQSMGGPPYDVLYHLGRAYRQYGQSVKEANKKLFAENMKYAAEQFENAISHKADAIDAYFQLGMCYRDLELYPQAIAAFKKALALAPKDSAIYYQLGLATAEQGSPREAEGFFLEGLRINPDHALIMIALGRIYIEARQIPAAISLLRKATMLDETLWEGWYELGRAHMKAREWTFAISALERARRVSPQTPAIYSAMALSYLKLNKKSEARQMINETLQRDPNNTEAIRLQRQL